MSISITRKKALNLILFFNSLTPRIFNEVLGLKMQVQWSPIYPTAFLRSAGNSDCKLWLFLSKKFKEVWITEIYVWYIIMQTETCFKLNYFISLTSCNRFPTIPCLKYTEHAKEIAANLLKISPQIKFLLIRKCFSFPRPDLILNVYSFVWSCDAIL